MYVQQPITNDRIQPFIGQPVCAVLNDGSRHFGILSGCKGKKLILNGHMPAPEEKPVSAKKKGATAKTRKSAKQSAAAGNPPSPQFQPFPLIPEEPSLFAERPSEVDLKSISMIFPLFL